MSYERAEARVGTSLRTPRVTGRVDSSNTTLLGAAWKHPVLVALVILAFLAIGIGFIALQGSDRSFAAEALVVVQDPNATESGTSSRFILEQVEIMSSPIVADAAASHLADEYPDIDAGVILGATAVNGSPDSTLVFLTAMDEDPERAMAMVNAVALGYQDVTNRQATQTSVAALERLDAQIAALESRFVEVSDSIQSERDANTGLRVLEAQYQEALALIAELQAELTTADSESAGPIRQEISDLQLRISNYQQAVAASTDSPELQALLEEQAQVIDRRTESIQRRDQIAIDTELASGAVALLQEAQGASEFSTTSPFRVLVVALGLGGFAAIGAAYLLEVRRRLFSGRLEPQSLLGAPLLADIPSFSDEGLVSTLPVRDAASSAAAEGFRFAAAAITEATRSRGAKTVMMVSSTIGHGKSTCVVNTSMADARRGHSVLLIDCDFGTQDAARLALGTESTTRPGLVDVIENGVDFDNAVTSLAHGDHVSLSLMGQGTRPVTSSVPLGTESAELFSRAGQKYDIVFVDGPPLLQVAYASTIANQVDALVVVVSHGTPVREMTDLVTRLQLIDTPVVGYIYNRSPLRREMTRREGSMRDITSEEEGVRSIDSVQRWWQKFR